MSVGVAVDGTNFARAIGKSLPVYLFPGLHFASATPEHVDSVLDDNGTGASGAGYRNKLFLLFGQGHFQPSRDRIGFWDYSMQKSVGKGLYYAMQVELRDCCLIFIDVDDSAVFDLDCLAAELVQRKCLICAEVIRALQYELGNFELATEPRTAVFQAILTNDAHRMRYFPCPYSYTCPCPCPYPCSGM